MGDLCRLIWWAVVGVFRCRSALQAEILVLRHKLNVLRRRSPLPPDGFLRLGDCVEKGDPHAKSLSGRSISFILVACSDSWR
jgi:hypothetical protein